MSIWKELRKRINLEVKKNFTEIRKLMGYKNEESISQILGITRQTLAKFRDTSQGSENSHNMLLISVLALVDRFIYNNRYDFDNIEGYIKDFHNYILNDIKNDRELQSQVELIDPLFFELEFDFENIEHKYINTWLKTFEYESLEKLKEKREFLDYSKLTINKIIDRYHIYITSEFLLHKNSVEFLDNFCLIMLEKKKKIRISKFAIDILQRSRLSLEENVYENSISALQLLDVLLEHKALSIMESNKNVKDELEHICNEILTKDISNVIVFTQENSGRILSNIDNTGDFQSNMVTRQYRVLSLILTDDVIDISKKQGYKVWSYCDYLKND